MLKSLIKHAIAAQHRIAPMPLPLFDRLFRSKARRRLLGPYGQVCFSTAYNDFRLAQGNRSYWLSKESLYWHFWRQTDTTPEVLRSLFERIPALRDPALTAVELGFGIGKNRYFHPELFPYRNFIGVEPNPYCVEVARKRMPDIKVLCTDNHTVKEMQPDVLLVFGGVLMYMEPAEIDSIFASLRGLKALVILDEGADADWVRDDNTVMYDFLSRLKSNGYADRNFLIEKQHDRPINRLFAMW